MPTLSSRSASFQTDTTKVRPILNRLPQVRPTDSRPSSRRRNRPGNPRPDGRTHRHSVHRLAVAIIIAGLTTAGCAQLTDPSAEPPAAVSQQTCVDAVFTVLTGTITSPQDDHPFEDFVNRYGTQSATYAAYRDSYNPFYNEAVQHGIKAAEDDVRTVVTRDCSTVS